MKITYDIPIFFLNYTRPHNSKLFSQILQTLNPSKVYIASDFPPQNEKFLKSLFNVKSSLIHFKNISNINLINLSEEHRGSSLTTLEALDFIFKQEEELIFLENDTLPNLEFFKFILETKHLLTKDSELKTIVGFNLLKKQKPGYFKTFLNTPFWGVYFKKDSYLKLLQYIEKDLQGFDYNKIIQFFPKKNYPMIEHFFKVTQKMALLKNYKNVDLDTLITMANIHYGYKSLRSATSFIKYNGFDTEAKNINYINSFLSTSNKGSKFHDSSLFNFDYQGDFSDIYFEDSEYEQSLISSFINLYLPGFIEHGIHSSI